jgi:hypothetical protein
MLTTLKGGVNLRRRGFNGLLLTPYLNTKVKGGVKVCVNPITSDGFQVISHRALTPEG